MSYRNGFLAAWFIAFLAAPAFGLIAKLTPLKGVIDDSDHIAIAVVESVDPQRPSMTLTLSTDLKGAAPARRMPVLLKGGTAGSTESDPKIVLDRVKPGTQIVLFITPGESQILVNAFTEGTWIQIIGHIVDGTPRWAFTHGEPYLRRTFKGTTEQMTATITAYLMDKQKNAPPAPVADEKPGFGPTLAGVAFEPWSPQVKEKPPTDQSKLPTAHAPAIAPPAAASGGPSLWMIVGFSAVSLLVVGWMVLRRWNA